MKRARVSLAVCVCVWVCAARICVCDVAAWLCDWFKARTTALCLSARDVVTWYHLALFLRACTRRDRNPGIPPRTAEAFGVYCAMRIFPSPLPLLPSSCLCIYCLSVSLCCFSPLSFPLPALAYPLPPFRLPCALSAVHAAPSCGVTRPCGGRGKEGRQQCWRDMTRRRWKEGERTSARKLADPLPAAPRLEAKPIEIDEPWGGGVLIDSLLVRFFILINSTEPFPSLSPSYPFPFSVPFDLSFAPPLSHGLLSLGREATQFF